MSTIYQCPWKAYTGRRNLQHEDRETIDRVRDEVFAEHVRYAAEHSPFYRRVFRERGVNLDDVRGVRDAVRLPFTDKSDLNERNDEFLAVPEEEIVDVCLTSGTSGVSATRLLQTSSDLLRLAYNEEISFRIAGLGAGDTMLISAALDRCFMAGLAYFLGGSAISAKMIRAGASSAAVQWEMIRSLGPSAIVGVPSMMARIAAAAREAGGDPGKAGITRLIAIGEAIRDEEMRLLPAAATLERAWDAEIYSTYASTELATTFIECECRAGGHERPEMIVVEIVDDDGNPLPEGERGEVVVTPLGVRGMPLVRYRTNDISFLIPEPCVCGRTTRRIGPILGRKNQMLKYKGTTVFPNAILSALEGDGRFHGGYVEARLFPDGTDRIILHAAVKPGGDLSAVPVDRTAAVIADLVRAKVRVAPEIAIVTPEELDARVYTQEKRKRVQFIDLRSDT
jgi:phenylacetate-CoA ligase